MTGLQEEGAPGRLVCWIIYRHPCLVMRKSHFTLFLSNLGSSKILRHTVQHIFLQGLSELHGLHAPGFGHDIYRNVK